MKIALVEKILTGAGEVQLSKMSQEQIEKYLISNPTHAQYFKAAPKPEPTIKEPKK